jgi:hypothetical protein
MTPTTNQPRPTSQTLLRLAVILGGVGELLQAVTFMLFGAVLYAMVRSTGADLLTLPPTGLLVAAIATGAAALPATLGASVLRVKGLRLAAAARSRTRDAATAPGQPVSPR